MNTTTITRDQIEALRTNAGAAGDRAQVDICNRAIEGDEAARSECARVIDEARASEFDEENKRITKRGRAVDRRYRSDGETDEGLIADGVHESISEIARELGVVGTWDSETLTWTTASRA